MTVDMVSNLSAKVDSYVQWAHAAGSGKSIVGLTRTGSAEQVQNLSRLPRGARDTAKQAALDDFRRALTDAVGETIADQAWKDTKAAKQKGLSASMIGKIVAKANDLLQKSMTGPNGVMKRLFNMSTNEINAVVNGDRPPLQEFKSKCRISVAMMRSNALLGMTPITRQQVETFRSQANRVKGELGNCLRELAQKNDVESIRLANQFATRMAELANKMAEVDLAAGRLPDGEASLRKLADHWTAVVDHACQKLSSGCSGTRDQIDRLRTELGRLQGNLSRNGTMVGLLKENKKKIGEKLQSMLDDCVKSVFGKKGPQKVIDGVKVKNLIAKAHGDVLNRADWQPICKAFTGALNGQSFRLQSDIVSGSMICESIAVRYEDGVGAYNSHSMGTSNAVNLATSKLTVKNPDDPNGAPRTVFSGVRHGVHSAQDITNKADRARANAERARQTVMAAFTSYLEAHPDKVAKWEGRGLPIPFNMTSISLLTPTSFLSKEKSMLADQKAAWDAVNNQTLEVRVGGRTYTVQPNIVTFNYGVDRFAVDTIRTVGWGNADPINKTGLNAMRARVHDYLANPNVPRSVRTAVDTLWRQILDITKNHGEKSAKGEAYKVPARLAVLSYLMGDVPVWNCKSGKDRTGMLDVEAKFLATLIDQGQEIPKPGAELTKEQSQLLKTIAMESGNLEMQEYNTGIAGYKLYGGASTFERLGAGEDGDVKKTVKGGSGYVGS